LEVGTTEVVQFRVAEGFEIGIQATDLRVGAKIMVFCPVFNSNTPDSGPTFCIITG
jgi:hypothetical protein